ncbi:MAG: RdgB/HAM1 family non-canonical purine NTP pyrophosphatase [Deltaproteobacteria bacterium]|nr:MAG: RdgB/HAM1 family non-canonical purine NTP pyrophosphatase [Deltaproteobacteria bacterium]
MRLVLATENENKLREARRIMEPLGFEILSPAQAGVSYGWQVPETGTTFEQNALLKTRALHAITGGWTLGDDSGLEVDALGGAPGVHSARYSGSPASGRERDRANLKKLLEQLRDVPFERRTARFVCVMALVRPDGQHLIARGECPGTIIGQPRGEGGFGYDPVFVPDGHERTMAEMSMEEKNALSHRGRALRRLVEMIGESRWLQNLPVLGL